MSPHPSSPQHHLQCRAVLLARPWHCPARRRRLAQPASSEEPCHCPRTGSAFERAPRSTSLAEFARPPNTTVRRTVAVRHDVIARILRPGNDGRRQLDSSSRASLDEQVSSSRGKWRRSRRGIRLLGVTLSGGPPIRETETIRYSGLAVSWEYASGVSSSSNATGLDGARTKIHPAP
jgi:hypothetical protein